jgi:hypothetical protein
VVEQARKHELVAYLMSIPGIGIGIAAVVLAYIGGWEPVQQGRPGGQLRGPGAARGLFGRNMIYILNRNKKYF